MDSVERCFGTSQTVGDLHKCLRELGERMLKMKSEVIQEIEKRVPGAWNGDAAQAFKEHMDSRMDDVVRMADGSFRASQGLQVLEQGLAEALRQFRTAEAQARASQCWIDPMTLKVWPATEAAAAAVEGIQVQVDLAKQQADRARDLALQRIEYWNEWILDTMTTVMSSAPFGPMPGVGARRPRVSRARPPGIGHNNPPVKTLREPAVGSTDGGPGKWVEVNRGPKGMDWQEQATGVTRSREYEVNGVKFDSFENGKLIDGKNDMFGKLLGGKLEAPVGQGLVNEANRQLGAAPGTPIEWRVQDQFAAGWVENVLRKGGVPMGTGAGQINVIPFGQ
jgi:uncharacterized protein YukE